MTTSHVFQTVQLKVGWFQVENAQVDPREMNWLVLND